MYLATIQLLVLQPVLSQRMYKYNMSCHSLKVVKDLTPSKKYSFREVKKMFFLETSCSGTLYSRQACSIESAARSNPDWKVYVLFLGPVSKKFIQGETYSILNEIKNVYFGRVFLDNMITGYDGMKKVFREIRHKSGWPIHHTADAMRFLILQEYGGVYLDLDMMVVKSLNGLGKNWVSRESDMFPGSAAIRLSKDKLGKRFSELALK